jgi:hypothetical protein
MSTRIAILGASGSVGSALAAQILRAELLAPADQLLLAAPARFAAESFRPVRGGLLRSRGRSDRTRCRGYRNEPQRRHLHFPRPRDSSIRVDAEGPVTAKEEQTNERVPHHQRQREK